MQTTLLYLTNLYNRRYLEQSLEQLLPVAQQAGTPVSLFALDIDLFKGLNDGYGHAAGDLMLQTLSQLILASVKSESVVCRVGGDEFLVVLPNVSHDAAMKLADEIRDAMGQVRVRYRDATLSCSISIGVCTYPLHERNIDGLFYRADQALYQAKRTGRNRVCSAGAA
jgi:diguanylate cyclase (GGDEF)-like protein